MLKEKAEKVMNLLNEGKLIEGTNGAYKIDGMHLTKKDIQTLNQNGLLKKHGNIGKYTVTITLSDKAKELFKRIEGAKINQIQK